MARKATMDPVEAVKLQRPQSVVAAAPPAPKVTVAPAASAPAPAPSPAAEPAPAAVETAQAPTQAAPPSVPTRARVKAEKVVSIRGQVIRLKVGALIADESFGPGTVARLVGSGVDLEVLG